jgi:fatty acid desaturase
MHAPNGSLAPSRPFLTKRLVTSLDYRHPVALAAVRLAAGICLVVLSALLFSIGDWWAAPLLLVAAVTFTAMFYVLRIVSG